MALTPTDDRTAAESNWPGRRLQDWLEQWGQHWPGGPDWNELMKASQLRLEEYQEDDKMIVRAELPGIDPENDVEITVADRTLRIRAERRQETKTEEKGDYRSEFSYGSFSRTLTLPPGTTDSDIEASYIDGILEVRIPIDTEGAEAQKIPITRG